MILETVQVGSMGANCYILAAREGGKAIIIDPGADARKIRRTLNKHKLSPALVINTHGHYDHIGCDDEFGVPVYIHRGDAGMLKDPMRNFSGVFSSSYAVRSEIKALEEGQVIESDGIRLKVLHTPGHTPGGISLVLLEPDKEIVFTGDSLFCLGIGRSDLEGGDGDLLIKSIREKLLTLPGQTTVYPGHGALSTIAEEKKNNPYL